MSCPTLAIHLRVTVFPRLPLNLPCHRQPLRQGCCARWASRPRGVRGTGRRGSPGAKGPRPCFAPIFFYPTWRTSGLYSPSPERTLPRNPSRISLSGPDSGSSIRYGAERPFPLPVRFIRMRLSPRARMSPARPVRRRACACAVRLRSPGARARLAAGARAFPAARVLPVDPARLRAGRRWRGSRT